MDADFAKRFVGAESAASLRIRTSRSATAATLFWFLFVTWLGVVAVRDQAADLTDFLRHFPLRVASLRLVLVTVGVATVLTVAAGIVSAVWWRRAVLALVAIPTVVLLVTSDNIAAGCAAAALLWPACWLGREAAGWLLRPIGTTDSWVVGATFGVGLLAALGYALGHSGALRPQFIWPVLLLVTAAIAWLRPARCRLRDDAAALWCWLKAPQSRVWENAVPLGLLVGYFWLNLIGALAPEIMADAVRTRLPLAAAFARSGQLVIPAEFVTMGFPHLGEVIYAVFIASGPLQTAKVANLAIGLLCAANVWALGRRLGGWRGGLVAALAFYTLPVTAWLSQTAYTDLLATLFAATAAVVLMLHKESNLRVLSVAGVCVAAGLATKTSFGSVAVGLVFTIGLLALPALTRRRIPARSTAATLIGVCCFLFVLWLARHSPVLQTLPGVSVRLSRAWDVLSRQITDFALFGFGGDRSLVALVRSPLDLTLHTGRYGEHRDGFSGYLLLALAPLVAAMRPSRRVVILLFGVLTAYLAWFATAQYLRYVLPMFAILCAVGGAAYAVAWERGSHRFPRVLLGLLLPVLAGLGLIGYLNTIIVYPGTFPYRVVFGQESKSAYLTEHVRAYTVLRLLDAEPGAKAALAPREYARLYTRVSIYRTILLKHIGYLIPPDEQVLLQYLDQGGFTHIIVDREDLPPEWDGLTVMNEEFLRRNAVLVGGEKNAYLFRLVPPEQRGHDQQWARGPELLPNGDFERAGDNAPEGWRRFGRPRYETSVRESRSGQRAVRITPPDSGYSTDIAVQPNRQYLLSHATRSNKEYGAARLQISWLDHAGQSLGTTQEVVPVSPHRYSLHSLLVTAPPGAATARVTARAQQGEIWFDDFSLRSVTPDGAASRPGARAGAFR